jgi:hypothetical protein
MRKTKNLISVPFRSKSENYVPPKPPTMRKVVRDKDNYARGSYEITNASFKSMVATDGWYTIYKLPKEHVQSFKSRQVLKYWAQLPPFLAFAKYLASLNFINAGAAFSIFLSFRYYS